MWVFIDTEFTDLRAPVLISVALVAADGEEFYAERSEFPLRGCTEFVKRVVLPLLGPPSQRKPFGSIKAELREWLVKLNDQEIVIAFDDERDWTLFCELLDFDVPKNISCASIAGKLDERAFAQYFTQTDVKRHHALHDARANGTAFRIEDR
jgi:hypothetical protein